MEQTPTSVKPVRAYNSPRRQAQAQQTRARIADEAERLFLDGGYAGTSVAAIAAAAGVSVDTVYKTYGGKPGLIREIHTRALQGTGSVPAEHRSDALQAETTDARRIIAGWGRLVAEIAPRTVPLVLLIRAAAAADPELRNLLDDIDASRLSRMTANAHRLARAGQLRTGVTIAAAADILWTYSSPELYELLVMRRGMSSSRYGRFVADAMAAALL